MTAPASARRSLPCSAGRGADTLEGFDGADTLDGGEGADLLVETRGDDTFVVDDPGDSIVPASWSFPLPVGGADTVISAVEFVMPDFIETLRLSGTADIAGFGHAGANRIEGNAGANVLDGQLGADTMIGGAGDDVYVVSSILDVVVERPGEGIDLVETSVSYTLPDWVEEGFLASAGRSQALTGNAIANLLVGNAGRNGLSGLGGADELSGGLGNDTLYGGDGVDTLDGNAGADAMAGGAGNDLYYIDNGLDTVIEAEGEGFDTVFTSVAIEIPLHVEKVVFNGQSDGETLTGNALQNFLQGNYTDDNLVAGGGRDTLAGASGDDTLSGGEGADALSGAFGDDWIIGGAGRDILRGGAGEDVFVFLAVTDSLGATRDRIVDFEAGLDRIDLRGIDAGGGGPLALSLVEPGAVFTAAGQIRVTVQADTTRVDVTVDDDAEAELSILLAGPLALDGPTFFIG